MVMVMVVVGHADAALEGTECPMSSFLYFLLLFCLDLISLTGMGEGIRPFIFTVFPLFFFIICYFLMGRGNGPHLSAPGAASIQLGCLVTPVGVYTIHCLDADLHINCVF